MQALVMKPWYRQMWPWLLIAPPLVAVIGGIAMLVLALQTYDGVVVDDYYKRGLAINVEVSRTQRAAELGIGGTVHIGLDGDAVTVVLVSDEPMPAEAVLRLRLVHPGRADADRTATLARRSVAVDGRAATFVGAFDDTASLDRAVAWRAVVETPQWRIDSAVDDPRLTEFLLRQAR